MVILTVRPVLAASAIAGLTIGCNGPDVTGPFSGQVVDAKSGKPIAGAVVVVVWGYAMHGGRRSIDAREAVTNAPLTLEKAVLAG